MCTLIITAVMCVCLIASILLKPNLTFKNASFGTYWLVALAGALLLVAFGQIKPSDIGVGLTADTAINPIKILVLFLSMTFQSVFLDEAGMFRYCAGVVLNKAGKSQKKLFVYLYVVVSVLTVFTSNDIIILTFTPFICYFAKNAKIDPMPYLFGEFVAANTWSMALIIGNPTNVYLATGAGINFLEYVKKMTAPTIFAGFVAFLLLRIIFHKKLSKPVEGVAEDFHIPDKGMLIIGLIHLAGCTLLLVASSYIGFEMWYITLGFAVSLVVVAGIYTLAFKRKNLISASIRRLPWELIPFVISMFVCVLALSHHGFATKLCGIFGKSSTVLKYGIASFITANLVNNIPMSVFFSSVTEGLLGTAKLQATYAAVIGSNLGAYFTPIGALAGIMWSSILKKHDVAFRFKDFIRYGTLVAVPTLFAALLGLMLCC